MKQLFKINVLNSSFACLASEVCAVYALYLVFSGAVSYNWLWLTLFTYMVIQVSVSVGLHRYYTHRSFECSRFWQCLFALVGTLSFHASPIAFVHAHSAHHKYSDSEKDSHVVSWRFFLWRQYKVPEGMNSRLLIRLARDPFQIALLEYGALFCFLLCAVLFIVSPVFALFGYVMPIALYFLFTAVHQTISHWGGRPRDMQWLEVIMPTCEWRHSFHHSQPSAWDWGRLDIGSYVIRLIKQ